MSTLPELFMNLSRRGKVLVVVGLVLLVITWAAVKDAEEQQARADRAEADLASGCANAVTKACTSIKMRGLSTR